MTPGPNEQDLALRQAVQMLEAAWKVYPRSRWLVGLVADYAKATIDLLRVGYSVPEARDLVLAHVARLVHARRVENAPTGEYQVPERLRKESERTFPPVAR